MQSHIFLEEICVTLNKKLLSNFPTIAPIDSSCTLEEYLEKGIDIFKRSEERRVGKECRL